MLASFISEFILLVISLINNMFICYCCSQIFAPHSGKDTATYTSTPTSLLAWMPAFLYGTYVIPN
jgi:hypothetical protein